MSGTDIAYGPVPRRPSYAMFGTDIAYGVQGLLALYLNITNIRWVKPTLLRASYAMTGSHKAYGATCLRASYAMSGTELACRPSCLRACYAMSGTDLACGATSLRASYAMSGTETAYGATRTRPRALAESQVRNQIALHRVGVQRVPGLQGIVFDSGWERCDS
eukprot:3782964-Rhodomonas_salina.1